MSQSYLDQAKAAATTVASTATSLAQQGISAATPLAQSISSAAQPHIANLTAAAQPHIDAIAAHPTVQKITDQTTPYTNKAVEVAGNLATQAQEKAHAVLPGVVPAVGEKKLTGALNDAEAGLTAVDGSHDLVPGGTEAEQKLDGFLADRPSAQTLIDRNILKGAPDDALAGKKAELERKFLEDKLAADLAARPSEETLVQEGILKR